MKRILKAMGEPEININNRCTCLYSDQFGYVYLVEYKVINLNAETFEDIADWDDYAIYELDIKAKDVTETFEETFIKTNSGYAQCFISVRDLTRDEIEEV